MRLVSTLSRKRYASLRYAKTMGAKSVPPGRYFRMHLVGYFEGIGSERGLEWRCSDSLSLREFLRLGKRDRVPDHSWLSRTRKRLPLEVHQAVFDWGLSEIAKSGLVKGDRIGVDASTMEANAALRNIVRRDTGAGYREMLGQLAAASGIETPTAADLTHLDRGRKGKKLSNEDWVSKADPEARIAKMKDGTTHLAYKPEHAVDLDTGAVVAAALHPADEGDTTTIEKTLGAARENLEKVDAEPTRKQPAECVADKGYHSREVLKALDDSPWKTRISEPTAEGLFALARRRGSPEGGDQQPNPSQVGSGQGSLQLTRRDRRAFLRPLSRSRRYAPNLAARTRERAQALPAPRRRPQPLLADAPTDRRRHPETSGGRGIWLDFSGDDAPGYPRHRPPPHKERSSRLCRNNSMFGLRSRKKRLVQRAALRGRSNLRVCLRNWAASKISEDPKRCFPNQK